MNSNKSIENQLIKKKEKIDQITAEYKQLQKLQKAEERKEQEKRAGKRGVLLEKLIPDVVKLNDDHFFKFLKRTVANGYGKERLTELLLIQDGTNEAVVEPRMKQSDIEAPVKPVSLPMNNNTPQKPAEMPQRQSTT